MSKKKYFKPFGILPRNGKVLAVSVAALAVLLLIIVLAVAFLARKLFGGAYSYKRDAWKIG